MTNDEHDFDVLIVGYGPVGASLAALLGTLGHSVGVLEQYAKPYELPRAGHFDGEIMRAFQAMGIAEEMEILARPVFMYDLVDAEGARLHAADIGRSGTGWKSDYCFYQPELEATIAKRVEGLPSVTLHRNVRAIGIEQDTDGVRVTTVSGEDHSDGAGHIRTFSAKYLVGADGNGGVVRSALGLGYTDLGFTPLQYLVCDFENSDPDGNLLDFGEVRQHLDPARPALFGRWNGNRWSRWEFMVLPGDDPAELEKPESVWELVRPWGVSEADGRFVRTKVYTFDAHVCEEPRAGRALIAGDAFHLMPPFMGQGMCSGIRDAVNLAWKLDLVLKDASDDILDSYRDERVDHVLAITHMSMELAEICTITDPDAARLRNERYLRGEVEPETMPTLRAGLFATNSDGQVSAPAGTLAPQGRVYRAGRKALLDDHLEGGWQLVTRHPIDLGVLSPEHRLLVHQLGIQFAHVTPGVDNDDAFLDLDATYGLWFRDNNCTIVLQRPDFYVFGTAADSNDLPRLLDQLAEKVGRFLDGSRTGERELTS